MEKVRSGISLALLLPLQSGLTLANLFPNRVGNIDKATGSQNRVDSFYLPPKAVVYQHQISRTHIMAILKNLQS